MSNNKMAEVAALLGVEIDTEFDIEGAERNPFKLTERGLIDCDGYNCPGFLRVLLTGEMSIRKRPWKPTVGEDVYTIDIDGRISKAPHYTSTGWLGYLAMGNVFPTQLAAVAARPEMAAKYDEIGQMSHGYERPKWPHELEGDE